MKTIKSNLVLAGSIMSLIIILASSFNKDNAQSESKGKYATMRTLEGGGMTLLTDNKIVIVYEDGKIEEIELAKSKSSNVTENIKKINDQLNIMSSRGYELFATSGTDMFTTTYTFIKK
jgi:hypothetical protein